MKEQITGSELIEKICNGEIKSGQKIIAHHTGNIKYDTNLYFHGNWFSKAPYSTVKPTPRYDDMILCLCDKDVKFEIISSEEESKFEEIMELDVSLDYSNARINKTINQLISRTDKIIRKISDNSE